MAEHARGLQAPIVCQRHGISERTLYRWARAMARARAEEAAEAPAAPAADDDAALVREVLKIVVAALGEQERLRVVQLVRSRLHVSREAVRRLLGVAELDDVGSGGVQRRVGIPLAHRRPDAPVADHFGVAPWLGVYESRNRYQFIRNAGRSGISMLAEAQRAGCTDLVVVDVGARVSDRIDPSRLRVWRSVSRIGGREQVRLLEQGALEAWPRMLVTLPSGIAGGRPRPA